MTLFGKTVLSGKIVSNLPGFFFSRLFSFIFMELHVLHEDI